MSKNKKKRPASRPQPQQLSRPDQKMNNGSNRQQKRVEARAPQRVTSHKPLWLRILIIVMLVVMVLGFFLFPLIR